MWEPSSVTEKKFNAETQRLIGEAQLHKFCVFLENYNKSINNDKRNWRNIYQISSQLILLDERVCINESISYLVHSDNKILSRIAASLAGICNEVRDLVLEAEILYQQFILYDDVTDKVSKHQAVSEIINSIQKVHSFTKRAQEVVVLTLKQLCAILGKKFKVSSNISMFPEVLHSLGDLLTCLMKLDSLLDRKILKDHWFLYRKSVRNLLHSTKVDISRNQLCSFDNALSLFEHELLSGTILKNTIDKCLEDKNLNLQVKNCSLKRECTAFIINLLNEIENDEEYSAVPHIWWKLNVFVVLLFNLFGSEKKIMKRVLEVNKKTSVTTLVGNIMWYPEQFLVKHIQSFHKYVDEKSIEHHRMNLINNKSSYFPKECNFTSFKACYFLIELKRIFELNMSNLKVKQLHNIITLFTEGLKVVKKINLLVKWTLNLHADKDIPVTTSVLTSVCKLIEVQKAIYITFQQNLLPFTYIMLLVIQHLSHKALAALSNIKRQFTQEKSHKDHQLDVLSSLNLCEQALKRPCTAQSLLVANIALSASGLSTSSLLDIRSLLRQLETFMNFSTTLKETTDCSFLLWHYNYILPVYFSKLISSKADLSRYYLMLNALTDYYNMVDHKMYEVTNKIVKDNYYKPLEQIIEVNLRLQTHLHLQLPPKDPFENYFSINFHKYLPAPLNEEFKSIKNEVEHHLSTVFYNLTSVVLHDWRTYGEMRRLASLQYGLETIDDNLPMHTLGQGLDVLEIMRNINVFVSKYLYNLNSQVFIERESNNKHLNSINISHVANSIRTHGIGIMNTTVNFTYQYLRSQFYIFSQFIFDEHIKSRLIKDIRFFSEQKEQFNQMYPYDRAEKFNIGIKKLGINENGDSYLDLFRKVITHIGNAMGYVRLIRSGGRRCLADGTCFIPDLEKIQHLRDAVEVEEMPDWSKKAANGLLENLQIIMDNIEESTEYFKLLVQVFVPVLRSKSNIHLKNFYVIVPPLTLNYIEHLLNCKEKLNKRNKAEYTFTDDGFALGLAYVIEILNQEEQLNTLHWFHSVQRKLRQDRVKIKEQALQADSHDDKLKQTLALSEKKVVVFEREFELLYYSYNSARLFSNHNLYLCE